VFSTVIQKYGPPLGTSDERSPVDFHGGWTSDRNPAELTLAPLGWQCRPYLDLTEQRVRNEPLTNHGL
jgi:hypothetical protein